MLLSGHNHSSKLIEWVVGQVARDASAKRMVGYMHTYRLSSSVAKTTITGHLEIEADNCANDLLCLEPDPMRNKTGLKGPWSIKLKKF